MWPNAKKKMTKKEAVKKKVGLSDYNFLKNDKSQCNKKWNAIINGGGDNDINTRHLFCKAWKKYWSFTSDS